MSIVKTSTDSGRRFAACAAILGALFIWAMLACYAIAVGGDFEVLAHPAMALAMTAAAQNWFVASMLADIGVYLSFLVVGGYFWSRRRGDRDVFIEIATLCITCFVVLGVAGASMQLAALPALAHAHATGDAMIRAASESTWLGVVAMAQGGLWWVEGPLMAFWCIVVGRAQLQTNAGLGGLLIVAGFFFGANFIFAIAGLANVAQAIELPLIGALSLWMLFTGVGLLPAAPVTTAMLPVEDTGCGRTPPLGPSDIVASIFGGER